MEANLVFGAWKEDGEGLHKTFQFQDFPHALAFVAEVGCLAQKADHHPDIDLRYDKVLLTIMTHSEGRVTEKDHALSSAIDRISLEQIATRAKTLFAAD